MYNCDPQLDFNAAQIKLDTPYRTVIAVPLIKGDEMLGALTLYSANLSAYQPDHLWLVEAVAKLAADALAAALNNEKTEASGLTDQLTGLPNARALRLRFEQEADRALRYRESFALLMMDLDGFKKINETIGRDAGDDALRQLACLLSLQMRPEDFLSRYAGDEFVVLVRMGAIDVRQLVQRLQRTVEHCRFDTSGSSTFAGVSVGWACFGADGESVDELLLAANRAMFAEKLRRKALISMPEDSDQLPLDHCRVM
jgi:diguanylate cyclase (GGDEF)-like protein